MRQTLGVLACCVAVCASVHGAQPRDGGVTNGVYYSAYFNFSLPLPQGALVTSTAENSFYARLGMNDWGGQVPKLKAALDALSTNSLQLLSVRKHPAEAADNWILNLAVDDLRKHPELADLDTYMYRLKTVLAAAPELQDVTPPFKRFELGGVHFQQVILKKETAQGVAYYRLRCAVRGDWALLLGTTARDPEHLAEGDMYLSRIVFDGPPARDN